MTAETPRRCAYVFGDVRCQLNHGHHGGHRHVQVTSEPLPRPSTEGAVPGERMFPVLAGDDRGEYARIGAPRSVPWALLAPHESQAQVNHDQSLETLASRGGLGLDEMVAIIEGKKWRQLGDLNAEQALARLNGHLAALRPAGAVPGGDVLLETDLEALAKVLMAAWQQWPTDSEQLGLLFEEHKAERHIRYRASMRMAEAAAAFFRSRRDASPPVPPPDSKLVGLLREMRDLLMDFVQGTHDREDADEEHGHCETCGGVMQTPDFDTDPGHEGWCWTKIALSLLDRYDRDTRTREG